MVVAAAAPGLVGLVVELEGVELRAEESSDLSRKSWVRGTAVVRTSFA